MCTTLFSLYSLAVKKDRDDQLLGLLWDAGLARHLNSNAVSVSSDFDTLYAYLRMICTGTPGLLGATTGSRGNSKSPPPETAAKPGIILKQLRYRLGSGSLTKLGLSSSVLNYYFVLI